MKIRLKTNHRNRGVFKTNDRGQNQDKVQNYRGWGQGKFKTNNRKCVPNSHICSNQGQGELKTNHRR